MLRFDKVKDDMATILIQPFAIAEPLPTVLVQALDNSLTIMDATVSTGMWR